MCYGIKYDMSLDVDLSEMEKCKHSSLIRGEWIGGLVLSDKDDKLEGPVCTLGTVTIPHS